VKDVQRLVSGRRPGDLPSSPADDDARVHVVRFEVSGTTLALIRQAQEEQRHRAGESVDDDVLMAELAQAYLLGGEATSSAAAQVMVTVCPKCGEGSVDAGNEVVALTPAEVERHCCDARVLPGRQVEYVMGVEPRYHAGSVATPAAAVPVARQMPKSHAGPAETAPPSGPDLHLAASQKPSPELLAELERRSRLKVSTELPRSVRELVVRRHHGKCGVPGCACVARHVHHTDLRSEGGNHDPDRLVPLCEGHHKALHEGRLLIDGSWSTGFRFAHADGTPYGKCDVPDPRISRAAQVAYDVLHNSGFKQGEARWVVDRIRDELTAEMPLGEVARRAFLAANGLPCMQRASRVREKPVMYLPSWAA
jgi:hypothetical protein